MTAGLFALWSSRSIEYFPRRTEAGPFRRWQHTHSFEVKTLDGREGTLVGDDVEYEVGFGVIGTMLEQMVFQRMMRRTFAYRNRALAKIFPGQ